MSYGEATEGGPEYDRKQEEKQTTDRELLEQILDELRQLNRNLTSRTVSDRMNEEMDLVK